MFVNDIELAAQFAFTAEGQEYRPRIGAELGAQFVDDAREVRAGAIHFIDEGQARYTIAVHLTPDSFALRLHTADAAEHGDSAVEAAKTADRAIEFLRFHDIAADRIGVVGQGQPGETLLEKTRELGVDLLVMGAYGRSRLAEFFLGSSTHTVIQNSPVPVFLFH